jgi:hypothetical protein
MLNLPIVWQYYYLSFQAVVSLCPFVGNLGFPTPALLFNQWHFNLVERALRMKQKQDEIFSETGAGYIV